MLQNELDSQHISANALKSEFSKDTAFSSIQEFLEAFSRSAALKNVSFKIKRRNTKGIGLSCRHSTCLFCVTAFLKIRENICVISKIEPYHTCQDNNLKLNSNALIKEAIRENDINDATPSGLIKGLNQKYSSHLNYNTAYKAIKSYKIKESMIINNAFSYLESLIASFDSHSVSCDLKVENRCFKRLFMTWSASKKFYSHNRKMITVDGTFLSGPNKGTLLVAVAQDGKEQLVLLAYAIVESENLDSWRYFLENLNLHFHINNSSTILMSDRDIGLLSAVNIVLPSIVKCNCVRHLAKNLTNRFRNRTLIDKFWTMVYTYDDLVFENILDELKLNNLDFYEVLMSSDITSWANSKCPIERYGKNTSNSAESMNAVLKKYVTKDICSLIISLNNYNMKIFNKRRNDHFVTPVFSEKLLLLETNVLLARSLTVTSSNNIVFLVGEKYIINYQNMKCSCKESFHYGIPCKHICAAILFLRQDPLSYIEVYFTAYNYSRSYSESIAPLTANSLSIGDLQAPIIRRGRGRPRVSRIRASFEN